MEMICFALTQVGETGNSRKMLYIGGDSKNKIL